MFRKSGRPSNRWPLLLNIKKAVIYYQLDLDFYMLSFGDWNEEAGKIDDSIRTNNGDKERVLATVAFTALDFTEKFPNASIFLEGSTLGRTRLYQMGIANNLAEISKFFKIWGYREQKWEAFNHGTNYEAFLAHRK